ncbi:TadE/TadG family type IV pilus assembly protein [Lichenifustis flavocetrariae]|uniref:Uncharacterized protein n=1 Tax=Lichenifustis flavocetrariae TaxID=2949735 RepID=A0AA41Z9T3_9HYPH|nr:hypothetical protein [Lichenifustis flavocetrariae]MCW6512925.1 hypothetical protein [Lichenifustis flavocetrariae]
MKKSQCFMKRSLFRRFAADRSANVAIMFCLVAVPVVFGTGMGLDYVSATRRRAQLNAFADGAALLTVNAAMMTKTADVAKAAAVAFFTGQARSLPGTSLSSNVSVSVTDVAGVNGTTRTTLLTYQAQSANAFAGVLGRTNLALAGQATASSTTAPNIDFYLLFDTSPSMAIAATSAGISTMVSHTSSQGGCAFACHQTNPGADNLGNPGGIDNYQLARNLGVTLRMDLVVQAAQALPAYASNIMSQNSAHYRMAIWSFDYQFSQIQPITSNLTTVQQQAANISMLTVYKNSWRTSSVNDNDQDTSWASTIQTANATIPTAGLGTNNAGDSPQETLFIVTDGVVDESNGGRKIYAMGGSGCTSLKARGVKIAILYTYYNPLPTNSFYNSNVKPFQANIGPTLQACASSGLYSVVNTGDDISTALQTLFNKAVAQAHLTN